MERLGIIVKLEPMKVITIVTVTDIVKWLSLNFQLSHRNLLATALFGRGVLALYMEYYPGRSNPLVTRNLDNSNCFCIPLEPSQLLSNR